MAAVVIPKNVRLVQHKVSGVWHFSLGTAGVNTVCGKSERRGNASSSDYAGYKSSDEVRKGKICKVCNRYARGWGWGVR